MSWPQNPDERRPQQPPQQPPVQGFGPPPAWPDDRPAGPPPQPGPPPHYGAPQYPPPVPGQAPGWGYPGHVPPPPPPPPRGRRTALIATGVVVALALVGGGVAIAVSGDDDGGGNVDASPSASTSASESAPEVPTDAPTEQGPNLTDSTAAPMHPGWQTQTQEEHGFRYDVPPASGHWKVLSPQVRLGYTDKNDDPIVVMSGASVYREGGCPSGTPSSGVAQAGQGQLATVGTQGSSGGTLQENARNVAGNWGFAAYGGPEHKPKITVSKAVPWKRNGIDGYTATATVTDIYRPSPCVPARATARGIAQRLPDGTISEWVIYADQGVPNALTPAEIDEIMSTVRPYPGN